MGSTERRDDAADEYGHKYSSPFNYDVKKAFEKGWSARDADLRKALGLNDGVEIEDVVKKLKLVAQDYLMHLKARQIYSSIAYDIKESLTPFLPEVE